MKKYLYFILLLLLSAANLLAQDPAYPTAPATPQNIVAAESFVDIDPGLGKGNPISIIPASDITNIAGVINVNGLSNGFHRLFIRTLNNEGSWSITNARDFLYDGNPVYPTASTPLNIIAAEYFIDTDPGYGNATAIPITAALDLSNIAVTINTQSLGNGNHKLFIRTRSTEGYWSMAASRDFIINFDSPYTVAPNPLNIIAAEYFIDTDPGFGAGTAVTITPGVDLNAVTASVNTSTLPVGSHKLFFRSRNAEGRWSLPNSKDFLVNNDFAYPVAAAPARNIDAAEYFIDSDPGFGQAVAIPITAGPDLNNVQATINAAGLAAGSHKLFIRTHSQEGNWSIPDMAVFTSSPLTLSPDTLAFQNVALNAVATKNLVITNNSSTTQSINAIIFGNPAFSSINVLPLAIAAGASTTIPVSFTPVTAGALTDSMRLQTSAGNYAVKLSGIGFATFTFNPDTLPFQNVALNATATKSFSITNNSSASQTINAATFGNSAFSSINVFPLTLAAGASTTLSVSFTPVTAGAITDSIRLQTNAGNYAVKLSGTGITAFTLNPDTLPFQNVVLNTTATKSFVITNNSSTTQSINAVNVGKPTLFNSINVLPLAIAAGASATIPVNFTPVTAGAISDSMRLQTSAGNYIVKLSGTGFAAFTLNPDTLPFQNVLLNTTSTKSFVITNNSSTTQTVNAFVFGNPAFSNINVLPLTIAAGASTTIPVSFTPVTAGAISDSMRLQTSAGNYAVRLSGTGIAPVAGWTIDPGTGLNFGNTALNNLKQQSLTLRNTGNIDMVLNTITSSDPAFASNLVLPIVIPVNGSLVVPVNFTPLQVQTYNAQLTFATTTVGGISLTAQVTGNGYTPGAPPVLQYVAAAPYNGSNGVNPIAGPVGLYTYKVLYKSANNLPPQANYPRVGIDLNGDGNFADLGEGIYNMVKEGSSTDYINGVVYSYTFNQVALSNTAGYQFFANDVNGNATQTSFVSGPLVTDQQLDLKIFANDITFSKPNPLPGETFTVSANITNSSNLPATNVPIKFYRDTILMGSATIPLINANSSASISKVLNFGTEGFYPIKVWIDSSNTLGESNILNNYAIRPVIVGSPKLPGGITASTLATVQQCPQLAVLIKGTAVYFGTGSATAVAGATVTINTGTQVITTVTDGSGNYTYLLTGVTCGANFTYTVSVSDFTFTSTTVTNTMSLPCAAPNACATTVLNGGIIASTVISPCANMVGSNGTVNFILNFRSRNPANMWSQYDEILNINLNVFVNGVLYQSIPSADNSYSPGDQVTIPFSIPVNGMAPMNVSGELSYTYVEYFQIPDNFYHGIHTNMGASGSTNINPVSNLPDLQIEQFNQTGYTAFTFVDANKTCGAAGSHLVQVFDSMPGGSLVLKNVFNANPIPGRLGRIMTFSDPTLLPGTHIIRIVTDPTNLVGETIETNNTADFTLFVPLPDLSISKMNATVTAVNPGTKTTFIATIKNTGIQSGPFSVLFTVNGVALGSKKIVNNLPEKSELQVISDTFSVTNAINTCGPLVEAFADYDQQVTESDETNNNGQLQFSGDLKPYQLGNELGAKNNPVIVRVNTSNQFFPAIRNIGAQDLNNVSVSFSLNGNSIGSDNIATVKAGELYAAHASFTHLFDTPGDYGVAVVADTANLICESDETNNRDTFYIHVTDTKPDFEVLSQYISPSSLNPNPAQSVSIVGTVRNTGGKPTPPSVLRFLVDDIQLGADVPLNALQPGKDTTVAATALYASIIPGVKLMKIIADPDSLVSEERKDNNIATRAMIVGDAPDFSSDGTYPISFNPSGFSIGDSVLVAYNIKNNGLADGNAWVRFMVYDSSNNLHAVDSLPFVLAAGASSTYNKRILFDISKGYVVAQVVNSAPLEFNLLNNADTLGFSTVATLSQALLVNGNLDMKQGLPLNLPGWIGGKLVLGDYNLTVNGQLLNFDTAHFVITNGTGKLQLINNNSVNTFPVGTSLYSSNFAVINNVGTPDNFSVSVVPAVLKNGIAGDTLLTGYVNRTWLIEESVPGGSNATVQFYWNAAQEQTGFDRTIARTAHFTNSWQLGVVAAAGTDSIGRFYISQSGYNSFSPFTVTSVNTALPLELLGFSVVAKNDNAELHWQTTREVNTREFIIQYNKGGLTFEDIATVPAKNLGGTNDYSFVHQALPEGFHYYRLKMVDIDGNYTYSPVRTIHISGAPVVQVYPNPAHQFVTVTGLQPNAILELSGADGKIIQRQIAPSNNLNIDLSRLAGGIYFLSYTVNGTRQQYKIVKE